MQSGQSETCAACEADRVGRFCHVCGQDAEARPRPLSQWVSEAFSEANLVDGRTSRTLIALALWPGRLLDACRDGAGSRYQTPTKLFVVTTALFLLTLNFADVQLYQYVARPTDPAMPVFASPDPNGVTVKLENVTQGELWMQRRVEVAIDPAVTAALQAAVARATTETDRQNLIYENVSNHEQGAISDQLAAWLPNGLWLLMPVYALLLGPFFGRRNLIMEHIAFAMWAHVMAFGLLILLSLANKWGAGAPAWPLVAPYLGYFVLAASRYYRVSRLQALWRGAVHLSLYVVFVLIPASILAALTVMDLNAFRTFMLA